MRNQRIHRLFEIHAFTPHSKSLPISFTTLLVCLSMFVTNRKDAKSDDYLTSHTYHPCMCKLQFSSLWLVEFCRKDARDRTRARSNEHSSIYIYVWKNDFLWWRCLIMMFHLSFFCPQHATSFSSEFIMFVDDVFHLLLVRGESFSDLQRSFLNTSFAPPLLIISCFPLPFISSQHPFNISVHQMGYKKVKGCRSM